MNIIKELLKKIIPPKIRLMLMLIKILKACVPPIFIIAVRRMRSDNPNALFDGRFRVCCFLTSLKFAEEGTKIIFDDYTNRPHYHFIENYVSRVKVFGRQCMFVVPSKAEIDMAELVKDIASFRNVTD